MRIGIIGAGSSGIIAALKASKNHEVVLFEKQDKIGKKILMTGNGKCNLWNLNLLKKECKIKNYYYSDNLETLNKIFKYSNETFMYLTNNLGIFVRDKDNYVYPYSQSASSVRETFEKQLLKNENIDVICNYNVNKIEEINNKFRIYNNESYIEVDKVVIACGYKSSNLGTNSIENLLENKNIQINKTYPALVPIKADSPYLKRWNGIRTNVNLSLFKDNNLLKSDNGEIQLTEYGISGIVSLNLSSLINKYDGLKIEIDFKPDYNFENYFEILNYDNDTTIEEVLETMFNYKLLFILLDNANINKDKKWNELNEKDKESLIKTIHHFELKPTGTLDYERSQVTTGGISLNEINDNMELNNFKNIYVIGEILDIDGVCGGYNLASAFITGYICGDNI